MKLFLLCIFLVFSSASFGNDETKLNFPKLNPKKTKSTFKFSDEANSKVGDIEKNSTRYSRRMGLFMGTSSHGFAPPNPCIAVNSHVQQFLRSKEYAAFAVLSMTSQKLRTIALPYKNIQGLIEVIRSPVAKDILEIDHVWTTDKNAPLVDLTGKVGDDLGLSWLKFSALSDSRDPKTCLTSFKILETLIKGSLFHQNSWLPTKLSEKQVYALTDIFLKQL